MSIVADCPEPETVIRIVKLSELSASLACWACCSSSCACAPWPVQPVRSAATTAVRASRGKIRRIPSSNRQRFARERTLERVKERLGGDGSRGQQPAQELARVRALDLGDLLGRPGGHALAARLAPAGPEVDDPVGLLDHV